LNGIGLGLGHFSVKNSHLVNDQFIFFDVGIYNKINKSTYVVKKSTPYSNFVTSGKSVRATGPLIIKMMGRKMSSLSTRTPQKEKKAVLKQLGRKELSKMQGKPDNVTKHSPVVDWVSKEHKKREEVTDGCYCFTNKTMGASGAMPF
jgi:hypothetical protein